MPYVGRNKTGAIVTVAVAEHADATEWLDASSPELQAFVADVAPATEDFSRSDQALIRVVEDIVNTLIEKNVIRFTDLPNNAPTKAPAIPPMTETIIKTRATLDCVTPKRIGATSPSTSLMP